jgi:hypothetical protein
MAFGQDSSFQCKDSFAESFMWSQAESEALGEQLRLSFMSDLENSLKRIDQPNSELNEAVLGLSDDEDAVDLRNFSEAMKSSRVTSLMQSQKLDLHTTDRPQLTSRSNRGPPEVTLPKITLERAEVQGCWTCSSCMQVNGDKKVEGSCSVM